MACGKGFVDPAVRTDADDHRTRGQSSVQTIEPHELGTTTGPLGVAPHAPLAVAVAYQGVWARTLLETPAGRDTTSWVRWVQTGNWHGALSDPDDTLGPRSGPGAEHSVFQTPDRIVQTALRERQLAVWERLPASRGCRIALARRDTQGLPTQERLLVCGEYLLHFRPTPHGAPDLAFGRLDETGTHWHVERTNQAPVNGRERAWRLQRLGMDLATVNGDEPLAGTWEVLEWLEM